VVAGEGFEPSTLGYEKTLRGAGAVSNIVGHEPSLHRNRKHTVYVFVTGTGLNRPIRASAGREQPKVLLAILAS